MKILQKTHIWLARRLERIVSYFCGEACEKCGKRHLVKAFDWARGRNHYCEQAYGDDGWRCYDCGHIKWDDSLDEHLKKIPEWCEPYEIMKNS